MALLLANCAKWKLEPYDLIPQVKTGSPSAPATTSVQVECSITSLGPNALTEFGIVFSSTNQLPTISDTKVPATGANSTAQVMLNGLQPNTTYYYRTYAINDKGLVGYGEIQSFKTATVIADVRTLELVGSPTPTSFQTQVQVANASAVTLKEFGIVYSTTNQQPTTSDAKATASGSGATTTVTISNLQPNTTYYYRAYAISDAGTVSYGEAKQIKTGEPAAVAETLDLVGTASATAVQVGVQVSNASVVSLKEYGVVYSPSSQTPTTGDSKVVASGLSGASVSLTISNLQPNTTYYYRAYAINGAGTVTYGAVKTFQTTALSTASPLMLYVASTDGTLYALDPNSGAINWKFSTGGTLNSNPVVANGRLLFGSNDGNLYALDPAKGTKLWSFPAGASFASSSPVVDGNTVYIGNTNGNVYAINATTGAQQWSFPTKAQILSSPSIANGVVYVGSYDNNVYAIEASTGKQKWAYTTKGEVRSSPTVSNGIVYIGSGDKAIYALDAQTGAVKWSYSTGGKVDSSPVVANGVLYVGSRDRKLYAFDAQAGGNPKWTYTTGDEIYSSPMVTPTFGLVYVGSDDYKVYAIESSSGTLRWSFTSKYWMSAGPIYANGLIYASSYDGRVYALEPASGSQRTSFSFLSSSGLFAVPVMAVNGDVTGFYPSNSGANK
ncbi:hypothetical protein GCM10028806_54420 [Spirosoma terrae]